MPRRATAFAMMLAVAFLAGCAGQAPTPAALPEPADDGTPASPAPPTAGPAQDETAPAPRVVEHRGESRFDAGVGRPCGTEPGAVCGTGKYGGAADFPVESGAVVKAVLVASWSPSTPLAESLHVWFGHGSGGEAIVRASGTSPLVIEVPAERVAPGGTFVAYAVPDTGGVAVDQQVSYVLALTYAL